MRVDRWLGELGIPQDSPAGREELEHYLETRRAQEDGGEFKAIRRGWCLGGETFRQELLASSHTPGHGEPPWETRCETTEEKSPVGASQFLATKVGTADSPAGCQRLAGG